MCYVLAVFDNGWLKLLCILTDVFRGWACSKCLEFILIGCCAGVGKHLCFDWPRASARTQKLSFCQLLCVYYSAVNAPHGHFENVWNQTQIGKR